MSSAQSGSPPTVVLTCGPSGSGKTTYARQLVAQGYVRLAIDEFVYERFGNYGTDVAVEDYQQLNDVVEPALKQRLTELITQGRDVVVDMAMWSQADRQAYKELITRAGGRWRLVYFNVPAAELRRRVALRRSRGDADAFPVTDDLLDFFIATFEVPDGEGEEVVHPPEV